MIALQPQAITAGQAGSQPFSGLGLTQPNEVKAQNESPFALIVDIGGEQHWLGAWEADVFCVNGATTLKWTPYAVGAVAGAPSSSLLLEVSDQGEEIPGIYPTNLDRMTNISAGTVAISGVTSVSITGTPTVSITGTPTVNIAANQVVQVTNTSGGSITIAGTINIGNTPAVTITGTPTVNISAGQVIQIQNVPAGSITVAGTINIGNTPSVTITGTPTVNIAAGQTIQISGTPTVNINTGPPDVVSAVTALGALNASVQLGMAGLQGIGMLLAAGTLIGTIVPEVSYDGGTTWIPTQFFNPASGASSASVVFAAANAATSLTILTAAGVSTARVRVSAYTSGTANATLRATQSQSASIIVQSGTINIGNTPTVTVQSGTVSIGNTPSVTISGTPSVTISSGTVNIGAGPGDSVSAATALGALNATVSLALSGQLGIGMLLAAGTLIGTIVPEVSYDGGTTWIGTQFFNPATGALSASQVFAAANAATSLSIMTAAGASHARVRVSAYTSGTANATLRATQAQSVNVAIGGSPTVNIGNTPSVSITSGSVTITSGTVNVQNPTGGSLQTVDKVFTSLGIASLGFAPGSTSINFTLPAGAVGLLLVAANGHSPTLLNVIGVTSGLYFLQAASGDVLNLQLPGNIWGCVVGPDDATVTVQGNGSTATSATVTVYAVFSHGLASLYPIISRGTVPQAVTQAEQGATTSVAGTATAPAAGAVICTITPGAGWYRLRCRGGYGSTGDGGSNMQLKIGSTVVRRVVYPGGANSAGPENLLDRVEVQAATAVTLNNISAGVASSVYVGAIDLTPVP